ncbi:MAG: GntR family transcriptional regulator [Firmicutes bacterium]|nr:GntR family transcriptional regulator [Bacillota bacterium]
MWLQVDARSSVPMYQQLVEGVRLAVARGDLRAGDRLPSVRELASAMVINHNTIARAYQELEREGLIEVLRGRGTFISQTPAVARPEERREEMRESLRKLVLDAYHLRMSQEELESMLRSQWKQFDGRRG